jgi:hypothetical protein
MALAGRVRALRPDIWPAERLVQERQAIVRDMQAIALTLEPRTGGRHVTSIAIINGRRVTVQQVRAPFAISVGKDL